MLHFGRNNEERQYRIKYGVLQKMQKWGRGGRDGAWGMNAQFIENGKAG